jgi:hypothetical protein
LKHLLSEACHKGGIRIFIHPDAFIARSLRVKVFVHRPK